MKRRLSVLREYRWSSWRVHGGAEAVPGWLETSVISSGCGDRSRAERRAALRVYTEAPIRQGRLESPRASLVAGLVLGDAGYARKLVAGRKVNEEEQTEARRMRRWVDWGQVLKAAEKLRGGKWDQWAERHGDWGRDGAMYVAVRHAGLRLPEVVRRVEGLKYQAAAQAVKRFAERLAQDPERRRFVENLKRQLSIV